MNFCVDRYSISVFIFVGYYCFSFDYPIADGSGCLGVDACFSFPDSGNSKIEQACLF